MGSRVMDYAGPRKWGAGVYRAVGMGMIVGMVGLGVVFIAGFLEIARQKGTPYKTMCASNLHQLLIGFQTYAAENGGEFPTVTYAPYGPANRGTAAITVAAGSQEDAAKAVFDGRMEAGSPLASMWLLVSSGIVKDTRVFLCPKVKGGTKAPFAAGALDFYVDFSGDNQIGYSVRYPWDAAGAVSAGWRADAPPGTVVMSDMAPKGAGNWEGRPLGTGVAGAGWVSPQHDGRGMNVAFTDAHVEWVARADAALSGGAPASMGAGVMVPVRDGGVGGL